MKNPERVHRICDSAAGEHGVDAESAPLLDDAWTAMFAYLTLVNDTPSKVTQSSVDAVRAAGWSDAAIYDAATVCAIFNFFNRWIDATGVPDVPEGFYEQMLKKGGDVPYSM